MRRKRNFRRRTFKRSIRPVIYNFKRTVELENMEVPSGSAGFIKIYAFYLGQVPNVSEFTNLFDQYRIMAVKITFYPPFNSSFKTSSTSTEPCGEFYTVIDPDGSGTVPDINGLDQYQTLRRTYFNRPHSRYLKPKSYQYGVQDGTSSFGGYISLPRSTWLDVGNVSCRYHGLIAAWVQSQSALTLGMFIRCTATYYLQFKGVR